MGKEIEVENDGDGHRPLTDLETLAAKDAIDDMQDLIEHGSDSYSMQAKLGVLQRIITAVAEDKEYRQVLLLAAFDNKQEAMLASDAITERKRYGVTIQPILDRIIAQCAVKQGRVDVVLKAMTNYTLNTGFGGKLPFWKKKQESKGIT